MNKLDFNKRPLSWSQISCFEWNKDDWYKRYILNEKTDPSAELIFGKHFADSCEKKTPLAPVTLLSKVEQPFNVVFNGIPMVGYADTFCEVTKKKIGEYKTGKKKWDQKRADGHGQITMYALMNYITNKIRPEECEFFIEWIPTVQLGDFSIDFTEPIQVIHIKTKRTMKDILDFGARINNTIKEMGLYLEARQNA